MSFRRYAIAMGAVALASLMGLSAATGDVPFPDIPKGKGEACVEDTEFMRRNHMSLSTRCAREFARRNTA